MTFSLYIQMLRNYLAYFSETPQIRNWWELCSLDVHCFPRVFLSVYFCLACQISVHAQFFGKFKTNASRLYVCRFFLPSPKTTFLINTSVPWLICYFVALMVFCTTPYTTPASLGSFGFAIALHLLLSHPT